MAMYQGQGKIDLAQQIAHTLLRRTTSPISAFAMSGRNPMRYRTSADVSRNQALQLLNQTGALKEMTARLETQLAQSPDSPRLYEQLIEYYQAAGTRDKVQAVLEKAIAERPDAIALRFQLAQHLEQTGKVKEACDHYLELLRQKPALLAEDFYSVRRVFDRAQRAVDLVKALETINLQSMGHPYYVIDLVSELLQNRRGQYSPGQSGEENMELALKLFERVFEAFPTYRNQLISRVYNNELWKNERVYAMAKRGIVPSTTEVAAQPWFGINDIYSYSSGGQVNAMFHQLLNGVRGTDKIADLRKTIETAVEQQPGWHGGQTMLALIDLKENKKTEAKQRLEKLVGDEEVLKSMPSDACWIVGQELDQFEDTRPIALRLFETAVSSDQQNRNQIQYSPVARLVKLYGSLNRKEDARELLQKQLRGATGNEFDVQYSAYMRAENSVWAANQFLELGCAVDAVRIFRDLLDDNDTLEQAGIWYGNRPDQFTNQAQNGLKKALASINDVDANEAIKQLLSPSTDVSADQPVLDLMLSAPEAKSVRTQQIDSSLARLLKSIAQNTKVGGEIDSRLTALAKQHPQDFSVPLAQALHRINAGDERAAESLERLAAMAAAGPLDEIPADRRPNSRQRREALVRVPLWLVAREFVTKVDHKAAAEKLAAEALEAARRQVDNKFFVAILYEWGKRAVEAGDRDTAEKKWSELLEAVTKRPERRDSPAKRVPPPPAAPAQQPVDLFGHRTRAIPNRFDLLPIVYWIALLAPADGRPVVRPPAAAAPPQPAAANGTPPLTISQFRMATVVAQAAAENGFPELSQRAVEQAMAGGIPVPDPDTSTPGGVRGRVMPTAVAVYGGPVRPETISAIETEVASTLRAIIEKWQGDEYEPAAVYDLLHPIVLPASRPADILLYADTSKLQDAKAISLGATLVEWAQRAEKLEDLNRRITERKQHPQSLIPALALQTLIALKEQKLDAAGTHLNALAQKVEQGALPHMVPLACQAAIPASSVPELRDAAFKVLQVAVRQQAQPNPQDDVPLGTLVGMVNKFLANQPQKVKEFYETFMVGRQANYSRYGGDYGLYLQWRDWARIADEAAKAGVPSVALDYMGRVADFRYQNNSRPSLTIALATVCRALRSQTPQERYEAWRDWTLPAEGRQNVRLIAEWVQPTTMPGAFLPKDRPQTVLRDEHMLCNFHELLDAAEEAGKFEELRNQVRATLDQKLPNAETLWALILVRANEPQALAPILAERKKTLPERSKREPNQPAPDLWGDILVYRACMKSPEFARLYGQSTLGLRAALHSQYQFQALSHVSYDLLNRTALDTGAQLRPGAPSGLLHWLAVAPRNLTSSSKPSWLVHEGHVTHLPGPETDTLVFAYPLTGEFQLAFDSFQGEWAETDAGYGGIICETWSGAVVNSIAGHESIRHPSTLRRSGFNRVELRVADGKMKFFVNNHLSYEEDASPTSPWLMLYTHGARTTIFRNIELTGSPVIPREVPLLADNRMDGWNCTFFGETQPRYRFMAQKPRDENDYIYYEQQREPAEHDWSVKNGVLLGSPKTDWTDFAQSWVYYHRPLCDGETYQYEFFYVPGTSAAYPTIGRLAFLLEPGGVDLHWIASGNWDEAVVGIAQDNRVTESQCRRGPQELPLKANEWNKVKLSLKGDRVVIALNDVEIYERPLEPDTQRLFGIFRDRRQAAKVRNAVVTGPWPEKFTPELARNLIATSGERSDADRRVVGVLLDDAFAEHDVAAVVQKARSLPDEERFEFLKQWVLPSPDHANVRLYYRHASTASGAEIGRDDSNDSEIISPAYELVTVAERLQKLPELHGAINAIEAESASDQRNKQALLALVEMKLGNDEAARSQLAAMQELVVKEVTKTTPPRQRAAEFVAAWVAAGRPALIDEGLALAHRLRNLERDEKTASDNYDWRHGVYALVGHLEAAIARLDEEETTRENSIRQWTAVIERTSQNRSRGWRPATWHKIGDTIQHRPGGTVSRLIFQSPLAGKFEITAEQSVEPYREIALLYGGHAAVPRHDLKAKRITTLPNNNRDVATELNIPNWGSKAEIRIVVDGTKVTTFAGGVQIHEEFVTPNPWLVLQAKSSGNDSTIQNVRITGSPEIPTELDLIDTMTSLFWQADLYGESVAIEDGGENAVWQRAGEEIVGELRTDRAAKPLEGLLTYLRPMLEGGTIEFEAYYVPGEFEVHPAVGRQALLLRPDGVKLHVLTDAQWEVTDLAPDNEMSIEGAAESVPLKANDWNRIALRLAGDRLTLVVNDVVVAEHAFAEPPSERFFGLFRYVDKTKCRVRKLVYRGNWPKQLPNVADRE
jgi:tetratricopeptide (TPR) repeat protein